MSCCVRDCAMKSFLLAFQPSVQRVLCGSETGTTCTVELVLRRMRCVSRRGECVGGPVCSGFGDALQNDYASASSDQFSNE